METPEWITQNAEALGELSSDEQLSRFGSVADLAKSYKEMSALRGQSVRIPSGEAGKEAWDDFYTKFQDIPGMTRIPVDSDDKDGWSAFHKKMGAPETPDEYKIAPEGMPEGVSIDEDLLAAIKPAAHARGVTNKQLNGLFETMAGVMGQRQKSSEQATEKATETLKTEWGQAYEAKKSAAVGVAQRVGGEDFNAFLEAHGDAAMHPGLMKTFAAIAEKFGEDAPVDQASPHISGMPTPDEARLQIAEIRSNKEHPFNNPMADPATKAAARQKMYKLECFALGQKPDPEQVKFFGGR